MYRPLEKKESKKASTSENTKQSRNILKQRFSFIDNSSRKNFGLVNSSQYPIQKRNIDHTKLGLDAPVDNKSIWLEKDKISKKGKEYEKKVDTTAPNKLKALSLIASQISETMKNDEVFSLRDDDKWVKSETEIDNNVQEKLNPFRVRYQISFLDNNNSKKLSATAHVGRFKPGYIIEQTEEDDKAEISSLSDPNFQISNLNNPITQVNGFGDPNATKYSEDHEKGDTTKTIYDLSLEQGNDNKYTSKAWEYRSQILGEGWRFEPVRELAEQNKLKSDSKFYHKVNNLDLKDSQKTQIRQPDDVTYQVNNGDIVNKITEEVILYANFNKMYTQWFSMYEGKASLSKQEMKAYHLDKAKELSFNQITGNSNKEVKVTKGNNLSGHDYNLDS